MCGVVIFPFLKNNNNNNTSNNHKANVASSCWLPSELQTRAPQKLRSGGIAPKIFWRPVFPLKSPCISLRRSLELASQREAKGKATISWDGFHKCVGRPFRFHDRFPPNYRDITSQQREISSICDSLRGVRGPPNCRIN